MQVQIGVMLHECSTATKYLLMKRPNHSKRALDDQLSDCRDGSISTIASEAGFSELSYSQRGFRKVCCCSPKSLLTGTVSDD